MPVVELDNILNNLKSDLSAVKSGNLGKIRAYCNECNKPLLEDDKILFANSKTYHSPCFTCTTCKTILANTTYYLHTDGKPYCVAHYEQTILPKCGKCNSVIKSEVLNLKSGDTTISYHPECFGCTKCSCPLANVKFFEKDGERMCGDCYKQGYLSKCGRCGDYIGDVPGENTNVQRKTEFMVLNEQKYHIDCFNCYECNAKFPDMKAHMFEGKFYCRMHYEKVQLAAVAAAKQKLSAESK
ncbi:hypothetical protein BKA69DRAFT_1124381 [Paraphysoderma sedebokerense]|nr:hypothetical protein BKA69DRAFT_1124381 [Paraphysoderma sedebokerense]